MKASVSVSPSVRATATQALSSFDNPDTISILLFPCSVTGPLCDALRDRWRQARRHAMGLNEIPYLASMAAGEVRFGPSVWGAQLKLVEMHVLMTVPGLAAPFTVHMHSHTLRIVDVPPH